MLRCHATAALAALLHCGVVGCGGPAGSPDGASSPEGDAGTPDANAPPIATDDRAMTHDGVPLTIATADLLANDEDPDGDPLAVVDVGGALNGGVALADDRGSVTFTPSGFIGDASFEYTIEDGRGGSDTARVVVTVTPMGGGQPPVADDQAVATDEDTPRALTLAATDPEGDAVTFAVVDAPAHGSLSGTGADRVYTPDADYVGEDAFTFEASDGAGTSDPATVTITVNPVNDAPAAQDNTVTTDEDVAAAVTLSATDVEGDALTYTVVDAPANGALSGTAPELTYTPEADFAGDDSFTFRANDGTSDSELATIAVTVRPVDDPPVAADDTAVVEQDAELVIPVADLLANDSDADGDALTLVRVENPANGAVTSGAAEVTFTPEAGFVGEASFDYVVSDGAATATATVTVTVTSSSCGDGSVDTGEQCDDANRVDGDGCSASCMEEVCGDGVLNDVNGDRLREECDDGNDVAGDGCSPTCSLETGTCSDGVAQPGEVCLVPAGAVLAAGQEASSVAVEDFDGDGAADLAVTDSASDTVSVLLGDGTGREFAPRVDYPVGTNPISVAAGDLDGDGAQDLVTANSGSGNLSVLFGDGAGAFGLQSLLVASNAPRGLALVDLDGDGALDIVTLGSSHDDVIVLMGAGDRTFAAPANYATGTDRPVGLAVADLDADGALDVAAVSDSAWSTGVAVLLGDGSGGFGAATVFEIGGRRWQIIARDLNGDGDLDLATDGTVLFGDGAGSFGAPVALPVSDRSSAIAGGDLDGDGAQDLVLTVLGNGIARHYVTVLRGDDAGSFSEASRAYLPDSPQWVVIGDVNGDVLPDVVTANGRSATASVLLGDGSGAVGPPYALPAGDRPLSLRMADVNDDGFADLVASHLDSTMQVHLGDGTGGFTTRSPFSPGGAQGPFEITDLNGDGFADIVAARRNETLVSVLLGDGSGTYGPLSTVEVGGEPHWLVTGDFDEDGAVDLVVGNQTDSGDHVALLLGDGAGSFGSPLATAVTGQIAARDGSGRGADVDADGHLDVAFLSSDGTESALTVLFGDGMGGVTAGSAHPVGGVSYSVALGDLDSDGHLDAVTGNVGTGDLGVLLGDGAGGFSAPRVLIVGGQPDFVTLADFDRDGSLDIAVTEPFVTIRVLLGDGAGGITTQVPFAAANPNSIATGDLDADGFVDLAFTNYGSDNLGVLVSDP